MFAVTQHNELFRPLFLLVIIGLLTFHPAHAVTEPSADYSPAELEELVGPVALYPDALIAILLPAASYPLQIVEAARYLEKLDKNPDLKPDSDWDDAIVALLNYPEVIALLNEDLDWTWNLGEAVVNQQPAVLDAIQDFRSLAVEAGNLKTDDRQTVAVVDEVIEVTPVDPEVIYVPYYEPRRVVVYQSRPVYNYYPAAYPVYYYPYPIHHRFAGGFFWGVTTAYTVGWLTDRLQFHYYGQLSHPYFNRHYTSQYFAPHAGRIRHTRSVGSQRHVNNTRSRFGNTWRPSDRHGDRPGRRSANTNRKHSIAANFTGSAKSHKRADTKRGQSNGERHSRDQNRAGASRKAARSTQARDQNSSTRRTWRRSGGTARKNTRVAVVDQSGKKAGAGARIKRHNDAKPRAAVKPRSGNSAPIKRTARRANTRAPSRQEHRPVRNTNRNSPSARVSSPPAQNHSTNNSRSASSNTSHRQSGGHRSGSRGGHRR